MVHTGCFKIRAMAFMYSAWLQRKYVLAKRQVSLTPKLLSPRVPYGKNKISNLFNCIGQNQKRLFMPKYNQNEICDHLSINVY